MDREKIIKDLEFCVNGHFKVELSLATKTLALLKEQNGLMLALEQSNAVNGYLNAEVEWLNGLLTEQDAVKPKKADDPEESEYCCGICGYPLWLDELYCAHCGRRIEWEGR